ncbi:Prolipoprotein diacylglyceryl transferase [uncultured Alphaproteobacteria bacterium]|uniref:Phosphatidylglycerol--prolipoprotein diacylglyceryl transferase n=1 Tax=uncultured Alphaproteobacteria bacterium TaxID=91750 RepID=A0A212JWE1_9PROT|nr:Prolipoprotein diacylglyceryl transferase [uncultured Alphaproteobacteria bacterium]
MTNPLTFPAIDPVAFAIGPFAIRWYALAYIVGLVGGWQIAARLARRGTGGIRPIDVDDFLAWATLGVVLGGRLGYVLFYNPAYYAAHPVEALMVWHGGMSFHGGFLGVVVAVLLYCRNRGLPPFALGDILVTVAPIGLFFGRLANFVNGELFGRIAPDAPFAMVFPNGGPLPRHPSQLYQAGMEGIVLFVVMMAAWRLGGGRRPGFQFGLFLIGYGCARIVGELFRQPDPQIGFLWGGITMGMLLSLPMVLLGAALAARALRRPPADA